MVMSLLVMQSSRYIPCALSHDLKSMSTAFCHDLKDMISMIGYSLSVSMVTAPASVMQIWLMASEDADC